MGARRRGGPFCFWYGIFLGFVRAVRVCLRVSLQKVGVRWGTPRSVGWGRTTFLLRRDLRVVLPRTARMSTAIILLQAWDHEVPFLTGGIRVRGVPLSV